MLFVEPAFLFGFLPFVLLLYGLLPSSTRNSFLLLASLVFYAMGEKEYVLVMIASISLNFGLGLLASKAAASHRALLPWVVSITVVLNLLPLLYFKYTSFVLNQLPDPLSASLGGFSDIHLPIGISFFTFQALSYVIDVARGETRAERNPITVGLYIALFPQLIAGPIVRYCQVQSQIASRYFRWSLFANGSRRFVIGAAKKLILANPMAEIADAVFSLPGSELSFTAAWIGALAYTFQIYFDFSGYSDMAVGLGRMFGFRIPRNFNYPYISRSVTEFWRRWHISLSTWFRDYLYIPLGGNRYGPLRTYRNLMIVFLLCGLWHGAGWAFICWGALHGTFLICERAGLSKILLHLPPLVGWAYASLVTIFGWVLFRAATGPVPASDSLGYFVQFASVMLGITQNPSDLHGLQEYLDGFHLCVFALAVLASTPILLTLTKAGSRCVRRTRLGWLSTAVSAAAWIVVTLLVLIRASSNAYNPFIYFQF